jgi:ferrous iron transport protein B
MKNERKLNIVLAGQANVGKSVIFNYLTGLHQHIGNWPGKTVERAEGTLHYHGHTIDVLDLPGIYSLSTYSLEELISREYITTQNPDFIINVADASRLERNLIFTLQLLELEKPLVLALNMVDLLKARGIEIDYKSLQNLLGAPVVPVVATHGKGLTEVLDRGIELTNRRTKPKPLQYGKEVEENIQKLKQDIGNIDLPYPKRWLAIKLLEKDEEVRKLIKNKNPKILERAKSYCQKLEKFHGHDSGVVIADERCHLVSKIVTAVMKVRKRRKISLNERLDNLTSHKIWGYPTMILILGAMFLSIFKFGNFLSGVLENATAGWQMKWQALLGSSVWTSLSWSAIESTLALIQIALPYIVPFYIFLYILENWGYLARVAFLTDNLMHKMGTHGKACIPLLLGFGCNVPACLSCRIVETQRERFITGFLTTLVPCSARTVIIMGLVGRFVGLPWAFGLYLLAVVMVFGIGKATSKIMPGEPTELIMEMPDYKMPNIKTIAIQTWFGLREFLYVAGPLVIISGIAIKGIQLAGWLDYVAAFLKPITVNWLGLPAVCGILLIFGILRKELILVMLAALMGTADFAQVLSPVQMITLALVSMFYIPCVATIAVLWKEFGWRKTLLTSLFEILLAIVLAGLFSRLLSLFM